MNEPGEVLWLCSAEILPAEAPMLTRHKVAKDLVEGKKELKSTGLALALSMLSGAGTETVRSHENIKSSRFMHEHLKNI